MKVHLWNYFFIPHKQCQCSDLKSIEITSFESIIAFEVLSTLESSEFHHSFVLKRHFSGLREEKSKVYLNYP